MTAQGEEVLRGLLNRKGCNTRGLEIEVIENQCRNTMQIFQRERAISLIAKGLSSPSM